MFVEGIYVSMPHAAKLSGVSTLLHSPKLLFTFEGVHILTLLFWCVTLGKWIYLCEPLFAHLYNGANNRSDLNVIMCRKPFTSIECGQLSRNSAFLSYCLQGGQRDKLQSALEDGTEASLGSH